MTEHSFDSLVKEAHQVAIDHGWWETPRDLETILLLILSEFIEMLEEYRNGKGFETYYVEGKPCGIPSEMADAIIRIADYMGWMGENGPGSFTVTAMPERSFASRLMIASWNVTEAYWARSDEDIAHLLFRAAVRIYQIAENENVDLDEAIRVKMEYNKTRAYRHGGKKC
jgi:NTP pyrophosphatase (non-canonical NTP hydrolase)